jgi:hypothetical protein
VNIVNTASPPLHTAALTTTQAHWSLFGAMALCLVLAWFLRRRTPGITASIGRLVPGTREDAPVARRTPGTRRTSGRSGHAAARGLHLLRHAAGWASLALFAVAGVCASGTFIGTCVLWASRTIESLVRHLPVVGQQITGGGALIVAVYALHKGLHLIGDVLEGKAHEGGADLLMFLGPMVFTLVPGYFGEGAAWVYSGMATHIVPLVEHL